jgi:hypothetical protein
MVHPYRGVNRCLSAAAHYEKQARRAADPAAQQKFLDVAAQWQQLAANDQSPRQVATAPSSENADPKHSPPRPLAAFASLADVSRRIRQLGAGRMVKIDVVARLWRQTSQAGARLLLHVDEVGRRRK